MVAFAEFSPSASGEGDVLSGYGNDFDGVALHERIKLISARQSSPAFDNHCSFQKTPRRHAADISVYNCVFIVVGVRFIQEDGADRR